MGLGLYITLLLNGGLPATCCHDLRTGHTRWGTKDQLRVSQEEETRDRELANQEGPKDGVHGTVPVSQGLGQRDTLD